MSRPLVDQLQKDGTHDRPKLDAETRAALLQPFLDDFALLEQLTGESFEAWRGHRDGDSFASRKAIAGGW
jgi:hypothetical protein